MHQPLLPYTPERDVYRLLGVPSTASTDEISAACRRLARTFHPDTNASARATAEMQVVNTVRRVLSDPDMRAVYDRERLRFHAQALTVRSTAVREFPGSSPVMEQRPTTPPATRYLRAVVVGVRAAVEALLPTRCRGCRTVIAGEDVYCAACGTPLLTGG
jgi:curved DNA-binding protein CbpA